MALQFILGGSGRGKSWFVNHHVTKEAGENPRKQYIVVVPEQFTMQTQKELISLSEVKGILNIDVQSFLRLAFRIFSETGAGNIPVMDDMGKTMILKKVLTNERENLEYFGKNIQKRGYIAEIKSFLSELMQYGIDPDGLEKMIRTSEKKPVLQKKLKDMSVAYEAFLKYIQEHYITSEEVLTVLADVVPESVILQNSVIYLDGFTGFTPVQYRLLRQLMKVCDKIYVTVTLDPRESVWHVGEKYQLFYMSRKTIWHLRQIAEEEGIEVCPEIWTGKNLSDTRFSKAMDISVLEQNLFRHPLKQLPGEPENITVHQVKQPEQEVRFVLEEIFALRQQEKFRYRDVAVVTGNLEIYGVLMKEAFRQAKIPCFIDQKKSILTNAFVDMICAVLDVLLKDFDYDSVMRCLKGNFSWTNREQTDLLDNFLLASGIRGHKKWMEEWDCSYIFRRKKKGAGDQASDLINQARQETWRRIGPVYERLGRGKHTVREYAEVLCDFIEEQNFYEQILDQAEQFAADREMELAREYEQIYDIVLDVLDRLVELLGTEEMPLREFKELLDTGFAEARIGLIPPGVDQVMVGDLSRTRLSHVKYLFFLGMNDCNIPQAKGSGGVISDSERNFLEEEEYELAPTSREQIYTEQFYLYLSLTKPSRHLYLTFCETGNDGKAQNPAYIIERIRKIFPDLRIVAEENREDPGHILGEDLGKSYLVQGLRGRRIQDPVWKEVYRQYRLEKGSRAMLDRLVDAAYYQEKESRISRMAAKALYHEILTGSTSQFERYASCPFSYFLQYGLKLEERPEHQVEFFDIGNIVHEALERYTRYLLDEGKDWQELSEAEQHLLANNCLNATVEEYKNGLLYDTERDTYLISRLRRILLRTVWAITEQMKLGKFRTVDSEFSFVTMDKQIMRGDEMVRQEDNHEAETDSLRLVGRIDRIDTMEEGDSVYVKVVDYKTGKKDLSLSDLYYGLQMQLVVYLQSAMESQKKEGRRIVVPAGVLYYNIDDPILEGKSSGGINDKAILRALRMSGLVNETDPVLPGLDENFRTDTGELPVTTESVVAPFETDRNGQLKKKSDTLTTEEFQEIIEYTRGQLEEMGQHIQDGDTRIYPYRRVDAGKQSACDYCPYHGICHFDARIQGNYYRQIVKLSDDDIFLRIRNKTKTETEKLSEE